MMHTSVDNAEIWDRYKYLIEISSINEIIM